jgi:sugar phosphate permease
LGGLLAGPFAGWWAYSILHTWRAAFISTGAVVFVVFLLFLFLQRNTPRDAGLGELDIDRWVDRKHDPSEAQGTGDQPPSAAATADPEADRPRARAAHRSARASFVAAVKDRRILTWALCYFLLKPSRYAILLWGPVIVSQRLPGASNIQAVLIPVAFGFGGIFGPVAVGWMSDTLFGSRRVPPTVIALLGLIASLAAFMPLTSTRSAPVMVAVLFVIGATMYAADSVMSGTAAVDSGSQEHAGAAVGFINGTGAVGAVLGGLLPGFVNGEALFFGFAVASALCIPLLLPMWRWRAEAA